MIKMVVMIKIVMRRENAIKLKCDDDNDEDGGLAMKKKMMTAKMIIMMSRKTASGVNDEYEYEEWGRVEVDDNGYDKKIDGE